MIISQLVNLSILHKNICCDPSSEPSHRDGSDDQWSQHIVSEIRKIIPQLSSNTPLIYLLVGWLFLV